MFVLERYKMRAKCIHVACTRSYLHGNHVRVRACVCCIIVVPYRVAKNIRVEASKIVTRRVPV